VSACVVVGGYVVCFPARMYHLSISWHLVYSKLLINFPRTLFIFCFGGWLARQREADQRLEKKNRSIHLPSPSRTLEARRRPRRTRCNSGGAPVSPVVKSKQTEGREQTDGESPTRKGAGAVRAGTRQGRSTTDNDEALAFLLTQA